MFLYHSWYKTKKPLGTDMQGAQQHPLPAADGGTTTSVMSLLERSLNALADSLAEPTRLCTHRECWRPSRSEPLIICMSVGIICIVATYAGRGEPAAAAL